MWYCKECNGTNVESLMHVRVNDVHQTDFNQDIDNWDKTKNFCVDCVKNVELTAEIPSIDWVKKLGQWHKSRPSDMETLCGVPMLGNNYVHHIKEWDRKKCPECFAKLEHADCDICADMAKSGKFTYDEINEYHSGVDMMAFNKEQQSALSEIYDDRDSWEDE